MPKTSIFLETLRAFLYPLRLITIEKIAPAYVILTGTENIYLRHEIWIATPFPTLLSDTLSRSSREAELGEI